ncbi:MAG: porin family protein [Balneolaceae bacterium]|nr:porin family protein [Balneolaceae bacterium]
MKKLFIVSTIILASALTFEAYAQSFMIKDKSGIGPKIGYYKAVDAGEGTMFIGAQTRMRGKFIGFELTAEYRGEQKYTATGGDFTVKQVPVTASLMTFIPVTSNFNPYALAGLGAYYTFYDYDGGFINPGDDSEVKVGYHLGFGADLPLHVAAAALNIDYRYLFLQGNDDLADKEFSGNVISAGLTFYF